MDSGAILCEQCGYSLRDLDDTGACPECGRSVATSLPGARTGTAWQRGRGLFAYLRVCQHTLTRPRAMFRAMTITRRGWRSLLLVHLLLAGLLLAGPWVGNLVGDPARAARGSGSLQFTLTFVAMLAAEAIGIALILLLLTWIECLGVRFFAARRGWRVTRETAWQVCAHAGVGWVLLGLLPLLGMALAFTLVVVGLQPRGELVVQSMGISVTWASLVQGFLVLGGLVAGLLVFETLVWIGVRECKYAASLDAQPADAQSPAPRTANGTGATSPP